MLHKELGQGTHEKGWLVWHCSLKFTQSILTPSGRTIGGEW
jgi:hypothetical protein